MNSKVHTGKPFQLNGTKRNTGNRTFSCIVLALLLNFCAVFSANAQKITISAKAQPLTKVLQEIRKQTGYAFIYNTDEVLNIAKPVTITVDQKEIREVLSLLFRDQRLDYTINGKVISIMLKKDRTKEKLQPVRGRVVDSLGRPLQNVTIRVKGTSQSTVTDIQGSFSFLDIVPRSILLVSMVGYASIEIPVNFQGMSITLRQQGETLSEVNIQVNKGYYNISKALNTGSVGVVTAKDIAKNPVGDPLLALHGRVAGLYVAQNSGIAGSESRVQIRGRNSIKSGNDPLYIVDGVPFPSLSLSRNDLGNAMSGASTLLSTFSTISMDNIERIEVLKDADATAIYGSRGANGVILITTKKGRAGKSTFNANVYTGASRTARKLDLMNTQEYLAMRRQALANDGITTIPSTAAFNDFTGIYGDINQYTDWQKLFIGGTAKLINANASISGGSESTQYRFGAGYRNEGTVFPGDFRDQKFSFDSSISHKEGRFKTSFTINYLNDNNRMATEDYTARITLSPNLPVPYNPDGSFNWQNSVWVNPVWSSTLKSYAVTENLNSTLNLSYDIITGLAATVRAGYNDIRATFSAPNARVNYNPDLITLPTQRFNSYGNNRQKTWIVEPGLNYCHKIGPGQLDALVGLTFQSSIRTGASYGSTGYATAALIDNLAAASVTGATSYINTLYRYSAVYARIGYNIADQYLLNLTGRRDASSRFGPGKQFANLGAIGAAWIFSRQLIVQQFAPYFSFGKIRASYGITGNDQIGDYGYLSTYTPSTPSYLADGTLKPTQLTNTDYSWETVKKLEAAIELGFLNDRIQFNAAWYRNRTGNQLVGYALPAITGFPSVQANLPAVVQNSGAEFDLTVGVLKKSNFKWTVAGNISVPRNKLVSYTNLKGSSYANTYVIGQPLSITYLYQYTGIDPVKQIYTFEDLNGDGQYTTSADRKPSFIGQNYFGGINNSFSYKGFSLDVFLQFVKQDGYKFVASQIPGVFIFGSNSNQLRSLDAEIAKGITQKYTTSSSTEAGRAASLFAGSNGIVQDASFVRLKNVALSWNLPAAYTRAVRLNSARIYLQGQNLLTFTKYKGFDPEVSSASVANTQLALPTLRVLTAGVQLSL